MVRAHRPHWALQPRQPYTCPALRTDALVEVTPRTSWSVRRLQEQMIMFRIRVRGCALEYVSQSSKAKEKYKLKRF